MCERTSFRAEIVSDYAVVVRGKRPDANGRKNNNPKYIIDLYRRSLDLLILTRGVLRPAAARRAIS